MMTPRRLEPIGTYHGPIWGSLPTAYPTEQAERVYRYLVDQMPADSTPRALMGHGFTGVAYRFRATTEYQSNFEASFTAPSGVTPPTDDHYLQERALFGFFVSGLACLECFAFALHAIGAYYKPGTFDVSQKRLMEITPKSVANLLKEAWPNAAVTGAMRSLVDDDMFRKWKSIRNVLGHRAVPPRAIEITPGSGVRSTWQLVKYQFLDDDEPLDTMMPPRRHWLEKRIRDLWDGVEQSFPPL